MAFNSFSNPRSPPTNPHRLSGGMMSSNDARGSLHRRFTTNALPSLMPIGQQRRQAVGDTQLPTGFQTRVTPSDRKIRHIENLLEQQRRITAQLEQVDDETRREVEDGLRHEHAVNQMMAQSEPTTPPEYHDAFPTPVARPNRYSTTSLASSTGTGNRSHRTSMQLTSPSAGVIRPYTAGNTTNLPSQSVPGSRRQSDDEEEEDDFSYYDSVIHRAAANPNRYSMPATSYGRKRNSSNLGVLNTTSFLFDDDEKTPTFKPATKPSPPDTKTYLQVQHTAAGFPVLLHRDANGELVSGSPAAIDLALSNGELQATDRATAGRHRISLPPSALSSNGTSAPLNSILADTSSLKSAANNRRSMEVKFSAETKRPSLMASPPHALSNGMSKAQSSYSTNDIPTLKSIADDNSVVSGGVAIHSPLNQSTNLATAISPEQAITRVSTASSASNNNNRQSSDSSAASKSQNGHDVFTSAIQNGLHAGSAPFGPTQTQQSYHVQSPPVQNMPYGQSAYYGGQGVQVMNTGFANMNLNGGYGMQGQWPNQAQQFQQGGYGVQYGQGGQAMGGAGRFTEAQRALAQRRKVEAEEFFNSVSVPELTGQIYGLCKDQHGCRYLQKKLEERGQEDIQIIFDEVKDHFEELMVDPFGNYLCQRLLEFTNEEQRTVLVHNAVPSMTKIALNQHGTRALQRMIEFIKTQEQTNMIIEAMRYDVVQLIQDLNGNHVIQKCLNHLSPENAQFIFDAVGPNCVTVGTHRHGCCVLQRCVDHASGMQKGIMIDQIVLNAFALVQDPFGNYVVQYILDLAEPSFTEPMCRAFVGHVMQLSKQKFSSNVIEKCIRCAGSETRNLLIREINNTPMLERLLKDSFANYVVQTAIDFAEGETKSLIIENVRPLMPFIRSTPYGRRVQGKIQDYDNGLDLPVGMPGVSPNANAGLPMTLDQRQAFGQASGRGNRMGMVGAPPQWNGNNTFAPASSANSYGVFNESSGATMRNLFSPPSGGSFAGAESIASPSPQRNQAYNMLNGNLEYQNQAFVGAFSGMSPPQFGRF